MSDGIVSSGSGARGLEAAFAAALSTQANGQDLVAVSRTRAFVHATMRAYFARIGLDPSALGPRVVHIAGTKGKGSTSAFVESVLRAHGLRTGGVAAPCSRRLHLLAAVGHLCVGLGRLPHARLW